MAYLASTGACRWPRDVFLEPHTSSLGLNRSLRELVDYREQLVGERTRCANRLHADLVVLCPGYQVEVKNLVSKRHLARAERLLADNAEIRAGLARRHC